MVCVESNFARAKDNYPGKTYGSEEIYNPLKSSLPALSDGPVV
jgi:hypothetical protein